MKEFIDKLIGRLEEEIAWYETHGINKDLCRGIIGANNRAISIINELAEEYKSWVMIDGQYCWQTCGATEHCKECRRLGNGDIDYYESIGEYINCSTDTSTISKMETFDWIPCSEKQPNKDGYFIVTTSDGEVDVREYDYGNGWGWDGFERIIAWQPIAPYTEGE